MNNLIKKSVEELKKLEEESRVELFALRFQSAMGNLEKSYRIEKLKKQIARILTILSDRRNNGENTAINVKVNLNETYTKIEKKSQVFIKQRKVKIEQMIAEQQNAEVKMENLMNLSLNNNDNDDAMGLIKKQDIDLTTMGETNVLYEQKESVIAKKKVLKSKTTIPNNKKRVNVKSVTSIKADIEVSKKTKKIDNKTTKKETWEK